MGKAKMVYEGVCRLDLPAAKIMSTEVVTGPFDVIALVEAEGLDELGRAITDGIQRVEGVHRTTTCLLLSL